MRRILLLLLALAALAGCGEVERVQEPAIVVSDDQSERPADRALSPDGQAIRIAVVTHGQASSTFWAIVRNGAEAAGRQMDVLVDYRAPDIYDLSRQRDLIRQAAASRPDGLVVSIPEPGVMPAIRAAVRAGVPVVTINSGYKAARGLGALAHIGQPEVEAGLDAGRRMAKSGVRHALCLNHQIGNSGLDQRCSGLARAMREAGGTSLVLGIDDQDPATIRRLTAVLGGGRIDGLLALNGTGGIQAVEAVKRAGREKSVKVAAFDLTPEVLRAVEAGRIEFAVDQQGYLQGYLPVVLLAERARFGLFPARGGLIPTGPNFVTKKEAPKVIELSNRSVR